MTDDRVHPAKAQRHDSVDAIVTAWHRELPTLDFEPLEVFSRIKRLAKRLDRIRSAAFAEVGLEPWEFDVLAALRRAGDPHVMTPKALLEATLVSSGTMTNRIDRLVSRELVARESDPSDGRGVRVRMLVAGRELVDSAIERLLDEESSLLQDIPAEDQRTMATVFRTLLLRIDQ